MQKLSIYLLLFLASLTLQAQEVTDPKTETAVEEDKAKAIEDIASIIKT